jgi:CRISPR-associated protein Cmr4
MAARLIFIHALSSLHAGTGQGVGTIDLPIARERATNLPVIPGSSIKGCLKDAYGMGPDADAAFGKPDTAGLLQVSDARLLLLPVRCLGASFVWTTSPYVLRRFERDLKAAGVAAGLPKIADLADGSADVATADPLVTVSGAKRLVLEDLDFTAKVGDAAKWAEWIGAHLFADDVAWQGELKKRFAILDDQSFHFLADFATEVAAHVQIAPETGTVKPGALWYQESLPAETVLVSLLRAEERDGTAAAILNNAGGARYLQLGGKATTGQGVVRIVPMGGGV